jgi:hypothetical protein
MEVTYADSPNIDAFSRLRVSNPDTVFDSTFQYDLQPLVYEAKGTGGGSVVHSAADASAILSLDGAVDGRVLLQSKQYHRYIPGKSQEILMTGCLRDGVTGVVKRAGYFDDNDGVFLEHNGTTNVVSVVVRSSAGGSAADNTAVQSSWNLDTLDGSNSTWNPSGILLDTSKVYILVIDLQWLGMGRVRVGFDVGGQIVYVHQFKHANVGTTVYMRTANLPIRWEMFSEVSSASPSATASPSASVSPSSSGSASPSNTASVSISASVSPSASPSRSSSASVSPSGSPSPSVSPSPSNTFATMLATCASVQSEGGSDRLFSYHFGYHRASLSAGNGVQTYAFSVRARATFNSIVNRMLLRPLDFDVAVTGVSPVLVEIYYGTTIGGSPAWTDMNSFSGLQVDTAGTPSGGFLVADFAASSGASVKGAGSTAFFARYPLTLDISGTGYNHYTVYVTGLGGASACQPGVQWEEVR